MPPSPPQRSSKVGLGGDDEPELGEVVEEVGGQHLGVLDAVPEPDHRVPEVGESRRSRPPGSTAPPAGWPRLRSRGRRPAARPRRLDDPVGQRVVVVLEMAGGSPGGRRTARTARRCGAQRSVEEDVAPGLAQVEVDRDLEVEVAPVRDTSIGHSPSHPGVEVVACPSGRGPPSRGRTRCPPTAAGRRRRGGRASSRSSMAPTPSGGRCGWPRAQQAGRCARRRRARRRGRGTAARAERVAGRPGSRARRPGRGRPHGRGRPRELLRRRQPVGEAVRVEAVPPDDPPGVLLGVGRHGAQQLGTRPRPR
jgi:hypothetical protein